MEADFNFANKTIYGGRMLDNMRKYNLMSEEIFSERNRMADDGTLAKVLFYDIVRQIQVSEGISSVDAANSARRYIGQNPPKTILSSRTGPNLPMQTKR